MTYDVASCPLRTPTVHITGHNNEGRSIVHTLIKHEPKKIEKYGIRITPCYATSRFPPDLNDDVDIKENKEFEASPELRIVNPKGSICRINDFAPGGFGPMHRTQSLDFGIVLSGTLVMELDDGTETLLHAGDVAVQRATMHGWKNPSDTEWCRVAFILQDCKPLLVEGERYKEHLGTGIEVFVPSGNDT